MSLTPEQEEIYILSQRGMTNREIADHLGITYRAAQCRLQRIRRKMNRDPAIQASMDAVGTNMVPQLAWAKTKNPDGTSYSVLLRPAREEQQDVLAQLTENIRDIASSVTLDLPTRDVPTGGNLLVLDPADVHIGKLSVATETGYAYDDAVAEHRLVEGSRLLVERAMREGVTSVLFVIGNDIAHIDTPHRTTTSGTPQDTSGTIFTIFRVAQRAYVNIVKMLIEHELDVTIIFNPSNHDWVLGWTLAQTIQALFSGHAQVHTSDYNVSERHRKYFRYGTNLLGLTHADGAKEADLPALMVAEARQHVAECRNRYWYLHHFHHKMRRAVGVRSQDREKDHIGMTIMKCGMGAMEGDNIEIEYIRSPSPPDGWHDRNGYVNRQAVEAFVHHPYDGQISRLTEWF